MAERRLVARACAVAVVSGITVACGGGGGGGGDGFQAGNPLDNSAPTITGTPPASAPEGTLYSFQPTAADADGNTLTFSIENAPEWATFDTKTGALTGTPGADDVGSYADIRISVSDGVASATLTPFRIDVMQNGSATTVLSWTPPTTYTDGSAFTDLAGYRVYYGLNGEFTYTVAIDNPGVSSHTLENLAPGRWHFVVTAVSSAGVESDWSEPVVKVVS